MYGVSKINIEPSLMMISVQDVEFKGNSLARYLQIFADTGVVVDMISQSAPHGTTMDFSFTASASDLPLVMKAISAANLDKDAKASPLISVGYSKLNLFGEEMVTSCGVAARALNEAKEILAYELTSMVHGKEEAEKAQAAARALFGGAAMDTEHMPSTQLTEADLTDGSIGILTLMVKSGLAASNGEARRLVVQGGVLADGEKVAAPTVSFTAEQLKKGVVIKKGKKVYHKVTL